MKRFFVRKRVIFLAVLTVAAGAAIGAYAYFTASGSGIGSANIGTTTDFEIGGTTVGLMYPGTSSDVRFTVFNPGNGSQRLGTITLTGIKACPEGSHWNRQLSTCYWHDPNKLPPQPPEITSCESFSAGVTNDTTKNFWMAPVVANQDIPPAGPPPGGTFTNLTQTGTLVMNNLDTSQDTCKNAELILLLVSN